jgi:hypothetical protein
MLSIGRRHTLHMATLAALCRALVGCTDLGDSSALPPDVGEDAAFDGTVSDDDAERASSEGSLSGEASAASTDASQDVGVSPSDDSSSTDQASQTEPSAPADAEAGSSALPDTGPGSGGADTGPTGAGPEESDDAEVPDAFDATTESPDTGADASGDTGAATDAADAAADSGGLAPCTTAGQTGCVQCDQTMAGNGVCTATEAIIVSWDIARGYLTGDVPDPIASCYECLVTSACIDSVHTDHPHHNCDTAAAGTVGSGAQAAETNVQACLNTLSCVFGVADMSLVNCANDPSPGDGLSNCYCGAAFPTVPSCAGAPALSSSGGVNGKCAQVILDGLGYASSTAPATVLAQTTNPMLAGGLAGEIVKCAGSNAATPNCPQCF